jgi:hypothetical protein
MRDLSHVEALVNVGDIAEFAVNSIPAYADKGLSRFPDRRSAPDCRRCGRLQRLPDPRQGG